MKQPVSSSGEAIEICYRGWVHVRCMSADRAIVIELFAIVLTLAIGLYAVEDPSTGAEGVFLGLLVGLLGLLVYAVDSEDR